MSLGICEVAISIKCLGLTMLCCAVLGDLRLSSSFWEEQSPERVLDRHKMMFLLTSNHCIPSIIEAICVSLRTQFQRKVKCEAWRFGCARAKPFELFSDRPAPGSLLQSTLRTTHSFGSPMTTFEQAGARVGLLRRKFTSIQPL